MCRMCVGTKSMTEKITEGMARGRAKKTGGVLINTFKINLFHLLKRLDFLTCGAGWMCASTGSAYQVLLQRMVFVDGVL